MTRRPRKARTALSSAPGARGFVTDHLKKHWLDAGKVDLRRCKAYFCGTPSRAASRAALGTAPVIDDTRCVLCDECLFVKPVKNCIVEVSRLIRNGGTGTDRYEVISPAETSGLYYNVLYIDEHECIRCFSCVDACPAGAISPAIPTFPSPPGRGAGVRARMDDNAAPFPLTLALSRRERVSFAWPSAIPIFPLPPGEGQG